ncbi:hypothetical protein G7Z17_g12346 [Cylindrodendrum hubeiense]|uniref:NADP-dependent oxidoreductase domain-containing protein n=1 Tax=Cylindrodendrum hubeiense TaxID=595255 RepID=A0A9P5GZ80_9HYPO|nr:hypothetical protein G7Z17_g12346 [Cylindrodendrum hubeiense]
MPLIAQKANKRIILGLMTFGPPGGAIARVTDQDTFKKSLDLFQSRGYNEVDTARVYVGGQQEGWTAQAGWKERGLTLATKVMYPAKPGDNTADKVFASVETSLKDLDRGTPFAETLEAMDKLHKAGKFVRFGVSNLTAFEVAEVISICKYNKWVKPSVYQGMYNCITRSIEPELLVACRRYGLDVVVYNPIAGGLLSGKIKSKDMVVESGRFSLDSSSGQAYRDRYYRDSTFKALQTIEVAVEKNNLTMVETALRWMIHHSALKLEGGNDGILIGASSLAQLESNLNDLEKGPLPEDVVEALDEAWILSKADTANYWHGDLDYTYDVQASLFGAEAK